jgi:multiple sugar transport system permease protein
MATIQKTSDRISGDLIGRYTVLVFFAIIFMAPVVFMIMSSLKPDLQLLRDTSSLRAFVPVGDISFDNYQKMFDRVPLTRFMFNSVFVTLATVALSLFICSLAAFSFVFLRWHGKQIILSIIIATFIVPFETIAVPLLKIVNEFGWVNTYQVQIIPFVADSLSIFLFYQFFKSIPYDLIEAARIDGATWFQIYRRIIMPISGPVIATAAILKFLAMYNMYLWPVIAAYQEEFRPVMVGVQYFDQITTLWGEKMAYLTIITVPVLIFYLLLQRAFIESIASSGIKG